MKRSLKNFRKFMWIKNRSYYGLALIPFVANKVIFDNMHQTELIWLIISVVLCNGGILALWIEKYIFFRNSTMFDMRITEREMEKYFSEVK